MVQSLQTFKKFCRCISISLMTLFPKRNSGSYKPIILIRSNSQNNKIFYFHSSYVFQSSSDHFQTEGKINFFLFYLESWTLDFAESLRLQLRTILGSHKQLLQYNVQPPALNHTALSLVRSIYKQFPISLGNWIFPLPFSFSMQSPILWASGSLFSWYSHSFGQFNLFVSIVTFFGKLPSLFL